MAASSQRGLFNSRRGRVILENLTAYLFLTPAGIIIFLFGIFPVGFAFFVSLHQWRRFPEEYIGLENYEKALGGFAYVVFFWLAIGALGFGLYSLFRLWQRSRSEPKGWLYLLPGLVNATAILLFINWFFILLPLILDAPRRIQGQQRSTELFLSEFFASFSFPEVVNAVTPMLIGIVAAVIISVLFTRLLRMKSGTDYMVRFTIMLLTLAAGALILQLTVDQITQAIATAREDGVELPIWSQIILISAGFLLLAVAYWIWRRAANSYGDRRFLLFALAAVGLIIGGYLLVSELPRALSEADDDVLRGFNVTVMYALGTVPFQLTIGLTLAYLLFQNIKGRSFFRVVYFLPYITPFVATSVVFTLIFSHRTGSPVNQFMQTLGLTPQKWLLEPTGIFEIIFGPGIPDWLVGPGLALVVIMFYNTWIYAGYSTVIFLAGLGSIPNEVYEAARIDGASGWRIFRHITLPLLSPTTFFLMLIATIGTFQAFIQVWLLRTPASQRAVDTINIYIFQEIQAGRPNYAYGSAMAFVLFGVILVLTVSQNRFAGRRVFYG
ncbi:MAG: ABC transporter permease subunit [Anaerolineae bacterium]|nr:ABC transporter permease subunit [Anaerolineae bacterium]